MELTLKEELDKLTGNLPGRIDADLNVATMILVYTLHTGKTYNMWRLNGPGGKYRMHMSISSIISVISLELFISTLDSFGVSVNDSPGYREYMEDVVSKDICMMPLSTVESIYELYDTIYVDITHTIYALHRCENDLQVFLLFMDACKHYIFVDAVIANIYNAIEKHHDRLLSPISDFAYSKYADVLPISDYEDIGSLPNDIILEYISTEIKNRDMFPFTYYEYLGKKDTNTKSVDMMSHKGVANVIYKIMTNTGMDEDTVHRMLDGENYVNIVNEIEYKKRKEVTDGRL